jgi:hypothetical protein
MADGVYFFDELPAYVGGSRNSGFIKAMIAKTPESFDLDLIEKPSLWLQQHYPLYGKEQKQEDKKKEIELPKEMNLTVKRIMEKMRKGREIRSRFMDGKTRDESGFVIYEEALKEFNDYIKKHHGIHGQKEASVALSHYLNLYHELSRKGTKTPEPKQEMKKEIKTPEPKQEMKNDFFDITDRFLSKVRKESPEPKQVMKKEPKKSEPQIEDWRSDAGYKDTVWSGNYATNQFNRNSQLPKEYKPDDGWDWLASKYGKLYDTAINRTKEVLKNKGKSTLSKKEFKDLLRLPFDNSTQMKDFFRDVLLADPIIYATLNINAHSTKAPATTNALREFKKWMD